MKSATFDRFGEPSEVLSISDADSPEPGANEVGIKMTMSPINPSDLMVVRGRYGRVPELPATPGFEGVGVVESLGPGFLKMIRGLRSGRRVAVLNGAGGNWQESVVVPATQLVPIPDDISDDQAACFFVNPATALVMIERVLRVQRGDWLLQTAAGGALGRMIIRLAKHRGIRTINVVRRKEQAEELLRDGGDAAVATNEENLEDRVRQLTDGEGVRNAIDAVGGATASAAARCLAANGRLLCYGTLSDEPLTVDPRWLMVGEKRVEGFWLSEWIQRQRPLKMLSLFRQITSLIRDGVLTTQVGEIFPLDKVGEAVLAAEKPGRPGKILLRMT